jgi:hypothetical protein
MHTDLQISSCWEHISTWNMHEWNPNLNEISRNPVSVCVCVTFKVILHQFWVKKIFPWKFNLEYGSTFTKPFMHVSSRNMFPTTRNLQIRRDPRFELFLGDYRSCALFSWWKKCRMQVKIYSVYHIRIIAPKKNGSHDMTLIVNFTISTVSDNLHKIKSLCYVVIYNLW